MPARLTRHACGATVTAALGLLFIGAGRRRRPRSRLASSRRFPGPTPPRIDPANFVPRIDNRYQPYLPGTRFHFEGVRGTTRQTDDEVVMPRTKLILGVRCTVVPDTVSEHGRPAERTDDGYAQNQQGNTASVLACEVWVIQSSPRCRR